MARLKNQSELTHTAYLVFRRRERGWTRRDIRKGGVRSVGVGEELIDVLKIECGRVLRARLEGLDRYRN